MVNFEGMYFLKLLRKWLRNVFITLLWILRQAKNASFHNYIIKEARVKPLAIFANGPSLRIVLSDREQLTTICLQNDVMMLNDSPLSDVFCEVKPRYYIIADPTYWLDTHEMDTVREPVLNALFQKTEWELTFFVPYTAIKHLDFAKRFSDNNNITVVPYHILQFDGSQKLAHRLYQKGLSIPIVQNVVVAAIFNGINLGYSAIDVYGVENSWTAQMRVDDQNRVCQYNRHYYDEEPELKPWLGLDGQPYKMHNILRDLAKMFDSYHQLRIYADEQKCKIVNRTKGSFIDAFERE